MNNQILKNIETLILSVVKKLTSNKMVKNLRNGNIKIKK